MSRKEEITTIVMRLFAQYPMQNMPANLAQYKIADMVTPLMKFEAAAVEAAAVAWWTAPENKWPPHPGALIELCVPAQERLIQDRAERREIEHRERRHLAAPRAVRKQK